MGRPVRHLVPDGCYFVTARCFQARLLLRPSARTNEAVGGVLARAVRQHGVELFAFVFASNHLHLLVRAPEANLPRFMQYLLANVAKKVGQLVGWRGSLWERRYSVEPVLDDNALIGRLRYILSHGVKEGLVRRCADWPGLSCLGQLIGDAVRRFRWFDWTQRWKSESLRRSHRDPFDPRWAVPVDLELKPLPCWADRPIPERRMLVGELIASIERDGSLLGAAVLGVKRVLRQRPQRRPAHVERSTRPLCHSSTREARDHYRAVYLSFVAVFREASKRWRSGQVTVAFPAYAIRPFLWPRPHAIAA